MNTVGLWDDPKTAWLPYQPGVAEPWDTAPVVHLHLRAGFGATWAQVRRDVAEGYEASLKRVLEGETHGPDGRSAWEFNELASLMEEDARRQPSIERVRLWWLFRLLFTPFPLMEKMTLAWHSHYATSDNKVRDPLRMLEQNVTLRRLWRARAGELHAALLRDPAMLKWLDGADNAKGRPNENLGREFLERFALGVGHYTEQDVREVARALTGWEGYRELRFAADLHDDAPKVILGARGNWGEEDVVRLACRQPAAALHVARRLYCTFVCDTDEASDPLLETLAEAMRMDGDVDVARGIEIVLRSRLFHSPACRGKRIKSPVEYTVGALRACEAFSPPPDLADLETDISRMGQRLFCPPNVAGWPDGLAWLGGSTILARCHFAAGFADSSLPYGPQHLLELTRRHQWTTTEQRLDGFATLLLGMPPRDARKLEGTVLSLKEDAAAGCAHLVQTLLTIPEGQVC
jgi:uncharacterized protein (DUF1800 family)